MREGDVLACQCGDCGVELTVAKTCSGLGKGGAVECCGVECVVDVRCCGEPMVKKSP